MPATHETVLAFDYGLRRIGVACGQTLTATAQPLITLPCINRQPDWPAIERLLAEWQPNHLIVGLPQHQDGKDSALTIAAKDFAEELQRRFQLPVSLHDETFSSTAASSILREQRQSGERNKRVEKEDIDQLAATLILQSWLDENQNLKK